MYSRTQPASRCGGALTVQAATPVGVLGQHHGDVAASKHPLCVDTGRAYHARRAARSAYKRGAAAASRPTRWTTADSTGAVGNVVGNAFANELPSNHAAEAARGGRDVAWADSGGRCQRYDPFLNRVTPVRIWPRASLLTRNFATLQTAGGARIGRRWESDWESTRHRVPHGRSVRRAHQGAAAWRLLADRVLQHRPAQEM
jgi:hypothetical protein